MVASMASLVWVVACLPIAAGTVGQQSLFSAVHASSLTPSINPDDWSQHTLNTCNLPSLYYTEHLNYSSSVVSVWGIANAVSTGPEQAAHAWSSLAVFATVTEGPDEVCALPYSLIGATQSISCLRDASFQDSSCAFEMEISSAALPAVGTGEGQQHHYRGGSAVLESVAVGLGVTTFLLAGLPTWLQYV